MTRCLVTVQFAQLATATKNALSAATTPTDVNDVKLQIILNVTTNSGPYYLDDVRFEN